MSVRSVVLERFIKGEELEQLIPPSPFVSGAFSHSGDDSVRRSSRGDDLAPAVQNGESLTEWGEPSPPGGERWGHSSASLSDSWVMSTTWDMHLDDSGDK